MSKVCLLLLVIFLGCKSDSTLSDVYRSEDGKAYVSRTGNSLDLYYPNVPTLCFPYTKVSSHPGAKEHFLCDNPLYEGSKQVAISLKDTSRGILLKYKDGSSVYLERFDPAVDWDSIIWQYKSRNENLLSSGGYRTKNQSTLILSDMILSDKVEFIDREMTSLDGIVEYKLYGNGKIIASKESGSNFFCFHD